MKIFLHGLGEDGISEVSTELMFLSIDLQPDEIAKIIDSANKNKNNGVCITFGPRGRGKECDSLHEKLWDSIKDERSSIIKLEPSRQFEKNRPTGIRMVDPQNNVNKEIK